MGTSLLPPLSLLELLTKGEYSLSKDSVVNCQEIQCFLLLAAAWATHKLFSPPQHSSASAQHLALLTLIRCLQLLFLLPLLFLLASLWHIPSSPPNPTQRQASHCSEHYTSPQEPQCIFPQWRKSFQLMKRRAELPSSPAAARGEGGRLPNNLCSFGIQICSTTPFAVVEQIHQLLAAISKMAICSKFLSKGGMLTRSLALWRWGLRSYRLSHPLEPAPGGGRTSLQGESCLHTE